MAAALALVLTLPAVWRPMLKAKYRRRPGCGRAIAVRPRSSGVVSIPGDLLTYHELTCARGLAKALAAIMEHRPRRFRVDWQPSVESGAGGALEK